MSSSEQPWEAEADAIAALSTFWAAGVPTMEIARRLGRTRNCVLSKSRRLGFGRRDEVVMAQDAAATSTLATGGRPGQLLFRRKVLENYRFRCPITGCGIEQAIQAAHIIPFRADGAFALTNGIALRADIHALFDSGLMTIEPYVLAVLWAPEVEDDQHRRLSRVNLTGVQRLPAQTALNWHIRNIFRASG